MWNLLYAFLTQAKSILKECCSYLSIFGLDSRNCKSNKKPCNTNQTLLQALEKKVFPIFKCKKKFKCSRFNLILSIYLPCPVFYMFHGWNSTKCFKALMFLSFNEFHNISKVHIYKAFSNIQIWICFQLSVSSLNSV